jgi:hypothetical protein
MWDSEVAEFVGGGMPEALVGLDVRNVKTGAITRIDVDGAFVAIGHKPATELFAGKLKLDQRRLYRSRKRLDPHVDPRRVRLRRRDGQDLPPGGHRRRHRLHGRAGRGEIPRRRGIRGAAGRPSETGGAHATPPA